jgi:hypothetical protein
MLAGFTWAFLAVPLLVPAGEAEDKLAPPGHPAYNGPAYNGIVLPSGWPPRWSSLPRQPVTPPYLQSPPEVIPIDLGRQLFVDDFLVESTDLKRTFHHATWHEHQPVLRPDRPWEARTEPNPCAMVFSDGVFYDPRDRLFKMWYMAGYTAGTAYATSIDGIHWEKPVLDVFPGTNLVQQGNRDSSTIWLDLLTADPKRRWKMAYWTGGSLRLTESPDGIHWQEPVTSGGAGDRTTFFYNPFQEKWVFSLRAGIPGDPRVRRRHEAGDFLGGRQWKEDEPPLWVGADDLDPKRDDLKVPPQLYNLDCVAYESLLLGLFTIWRGQPRDRAKPNEICLGFSRDGFHWHRPDRSAFIPVSEKQGDWNWGNVQSAGGGCLVVGDKLYFYASGRAGVPGSTASGACSTGLALLRRDGFASLDAGDRPGQVTTRPLRFSGRFLFVNVSAAQGELRAEALDEARKPIPPFTRESCRPVRADGTRLAVTWDGAPDLNSLANKPVRFRFHLTRGQLFAFWVSPEESGASHGHVAAGGPGFTGPTDTAGENRGR